MSKTPVLSANPPGYKRPSDKRGPKFTPFIDTMALQANGKPIYVIAMRVPREIQVAPLVALTDPTMDLGLARAQLREVRQLAGEVLLAAHKRDTNFVMNWLKRPRR